MIPVLVVALAVAAAPAAAAPADPPAEATRPLHDAVTQAIRNCPQSKGDEIAVCARDRGFSEKYRIKRLDRPAAPVAAPKVELSGAGSTIPGHCTNLGQAGAIGCSRQDYDAWGAWKREQQADGRSFPW